MNTQLLGNRKKVLRNGGRKGTMTFEQFAPIWSKENMAQGGRIGFDQGRASDVRRIL